MKIFKNKEEEENGSVVLKRYKRSSNGDISSHFIAEKHGSIRNIDEEEEDETVDYELDANGDMIRTHGMHWIITAFCVVGNQAGGGIVALPSAVIESQFYFGIILVAVMGFGLGFTGYCIGQCWVLLQRMYPEYRKHCRRPYAEIGYRAMGPIVKTIVSVFIWANLFGTAVVFLLLASKNIHDFMKAFFSDFDVSFCIIVLFVALFLLPITFLRSPEDFWWTVVASTIATCSAVGLIVYGTLRDYDTCEPHRTMPDFRINNYFLAFATLTFAYAGHSSFPTLQHDMKIPKEFSKANALGFAIVVAMYIPVCLVGYLSYGNSLRDSVINSIQTKWIQQTINVTITLHLILSLTIVFNPLNQEVEEYFETPHEFGIKRVIIRLSVMVAIVFLAELCNLLRQ
uniref:Amino acid transporter transmembrane domain-containing protein n=1 Tax=Panagrolaimus superbus TaxID=310955 RepID=A0A914ZAL7_9BILA